jgi:membrane-bound metal-dependent hydrolase YbcI (DUF457 family)
MLGGVTAWLGVCAVLPVPTVAVLAGAPVAAVASLGPDIDSEQSTAARTLGWFTYRLALKIKRSLGGHRGGMHSLLVGIPLCAAAGVAAALGVGVPVVVQTGASVGVLWPLVAVAGAASFVGALSHSVLDSPTNHGVQWLWPVSRRRFGFDWLRVGGTGETMVRFVLTVAAILAAAATVMG